MQINCTSVPVPNLNFTESVTVAPAKLSLAGRHGLGSRKVSTETVPSLVRSSEAKHTVKYGIRKKKGKGEEMISEHRFPLTMLQFLQVRLYLKSKPRVLQD